MNRSLFVFKPGNLSGDCRSIGRVLLLAVWSSFSTIVEERSFEDHLVLRDPPSLDGALSNACIRRFIYGP